MLTQESLEEAYEEIRREQFERACTLLGWEVDLSEDDDGLSATVSKTLPGGETIRLTVYGYDVESLNDELFERLDDEDIRGEKAKALDELCREVTEICRYIRTPKIEGCERDYHSESDEELAAIANESTEIDADALYELCCRAGLEKRYLKAQACINSFGCSEETPEEVCIEAAEALGIDLSDAF